MIVNASFFFFSWTDKNKLHVLASSLWATSHLMWPLLSNTAVLPEEGGSLARKHLLWTPRTVVHFFFAKQTPRSQTASPCHTSAAERWQTTAHNIRTDTPGDTEAPNDKTLALRRSRRTAGLSNVCEKPNIWGCCKRKTWVVPECRMFWSL